MKIVVSYLNSIYDEKKTIDLINETDADGIHVDLMDGIYAGVKNFSIATLTNILVDNNKPLDIHLMINNPSESIDDFIKLNPDCIYIHPKTEPTVISVLKKIKSFAIKSGIVINPDESIEDYACYFPYVDRILVMSVVPGAGGQKFIASTTHKIRTLKEYQKNNTFSIYVDGGINDENISLLTDVDGVVVGSFICKNSDFTMQLEKIRANIKN